jgi:glutamyl-tRNA reductase
VIRREAVAEAERMIADQTGISRWMEGRSIRPTIAALHDHHEVLRSADSPRARCRRRASPERALMRSRAVSPEALHQPCRRSRGWRGERAE